MHCQERNVLIIVQGQQEGSQARPLGQVEGLLCLFRRQTHCLGLSLGLWQVRQVYHWQRKPQLWRDAGCGWRDAGHRWRDAGHRWRDDLDWLAVHDCEGGTQDLVSAYDFVEASLQCVYVQLPLQPHCHRNVVKEVPGLQLIQKPQPLLGK